MDRKHKRKKKSVRHLFIRGIHTREMKNVKKTKTDTSYHRLRGFRCLRMSDSVNKTKFVSVCAVEIKLQSVVI